MSPQIVCARLKLASADQRLAGGLRRSCDVFILVICMYAPTVHAPGVMMKCFYDDLQDLLSSILPNDLLVMLGDLLACGIDPLSCSQMRWVALELMIVIKLAKIY